MNYKYFFLINFNILLQESISFEDREDVGIDDYGSSEDSFNVNENESKVPEEVKAYGNTDEDNHETEYVFEKSVVKGKKSCERYRKTKICSVKGCTSKPQKKSATHMLIQHKDISPKSRKKLCLTARTATMPVSKAQKCLNFKEVAKSTPIIKDIEVSIEKPIVRKVMGSTREMKSYQLDHPELVQFIKYLQCIDGGARSPATSKLICKDISKYLYFANSNKLDWNTFLNKVKLLEYFECLKDCVGPEGILTKMERTGDVLNYLIMYNSDPNFQAKVKCVEESLRKWKYTLRKEKKKLAHKRLEALSDSKLDLLFVKKFIHDSSMWRDLIR